MGVVWIGISFWLSLITNVVVFLGVLSLFYWVRGNVRNQFVIKHRLALELTICFAFEAYLFIESLTNTRLGPNAFGLHWTFLNLIIIAYFIFSIVLQSKWEFLIGAAATLAYVLTRTSHLTPAIIGSVLMVLALQYWMSGHGSYLLHHQGSAILFIGVFAALCIHTIALLFPAPPDPWFWVRQVGAFVILATVTAVYSMALARRNADLVQFHTEATTDPLTGIKNMGSFNSDLTRLYDNFEQNGVRYRLFELDVDHFKSINDTYGHLVGNEVLKQVAKTLQLIAAEQDGGTKVYRMGGEEFGIIMQAAEVCPQRAHAIGLEINQRISELEFTANDKHFHITVSIGLEVVLAEDNNYLDIYSKADHYLYQSKHSGRNAMTYDGKTYSFN